MEGIGVLIRVCNCVSSSAGVCNIGLEAILSRECFPDLVILIKYASFDRNRVTVFAF